MEYKNFTIQQIQLLGNRYVTNERLLKKLDDRLSLRAEIMMCAKKHTMRKLSKKESQIMEDPDYGLIQVLDHAGYRAGLWR